MTTTALASSAWTTPRAFQATNKTKRLNHMYMSANCLQATLKSSHVTRSGTALPGMFSSPWTTTRLAVMPAARRGLEQRGIDITCSNQRFR